MFRITDYPGEGRLDYMIQQVAIAFDTQPSRCVLCVKKIDYYNEKKNEEKLE